MTSKTDNSQCQAEFHSKDGEDSLPYGCHTLFCSLEENHKGVHNFRFGYSSANDARQKCDCPRCTKQMGVL